MSGAPSGVVKFTDYVALNFHPIFIITSKTWSSLRAVGPTGRKLGQDSLLC